MLPFFKEIGASVFYPGKLQKGGTKHQRLHVTYVYQYSAGVRKFDQSFQRTSEQTTMGH